MRTFRRMTGCAAVLAAIALVAALGMTFGVQSGSTALAVGAEDGSITAQAGACEAGSYVGSTWAYGLYGADRNATRKTAIASAQGACEANCGPLDACPPNKPTCQGTAHVGALTCSEVYFWGNLVWMCSGDYRCTCACAGNH